MPPPPCSPCSNWGGHSEDPGPEAGPARGPDNLAAKARGKQGREGGCAAPHGRAPCRLLTDWLTAGGAMIARFRSLISLPQCVARLLTVMVQFVGLRCTQLRSPRALPCAGDRGSPARRSVPLRPQAHIRGRWDAAAGRAEGCRRGPGCVGGDGCGSGRQGAQGRGGGRAEMAGEDSGRGEGGGEQKCPGGVRGRLRHLHCTCLPARLPPLHDLHRTCLPARLPCCFLLSTPPVHPSSPPCRLPPGRPISHTLVCGVPRRVPSHAPLRRP